MCVCRHTVASSWLPRLLGLVVGDVPAGRAASTNTCGPGLGGNTNGNTNGMGEAGGNLTKMFITVFNGVVDYMPHSQRSVSASSSIYGVGGVPGCVALMHVARAM